MNSEMSHLKGFLFLWTDTTCTVDHVTFLITAVVTNDAFKWFLFFHAHMQHVFFKLAFWEQWKLQMSHLKGVFPL